MLPSWLAESPALRPLDRRRRSPLVARTLAETRRFLETAVFAERVARRRGLLQSLDARAKLLTTVGLLVAAAFLRHVLSLWLVGLFAGAALVASRMRPREVVHRAWWLVPGLFVLVALPATLNVITPGETLFTLVRLGEGTHLGPVSLPASLTVTRQGAASAALLVTRIAVGVLLALTLALTTRWQDLTKAAYTSATAPFVLVLLMTYRYIFVLLRLLEDMHVARRARTITPGSLGEERRWIGSRAGALFVRSQRLTERVYGAMLARGFRGEATALVASRFGIREILWMMLCIGAAASSLALDRSLLAGLAW